VLVKQVSDHNRLPDDLGGYLYGGCRSARRIRLFVS